MTVEVPAGIADGQRVRIAGRGHAGEPRRPCRATSTCCPRARGRALRARGRRPVTVLDVPAPLAALGASFEVPTLDGHASVEVAAGTQPGEVLTLRGHGMPHLQRHGHGDLRVVVNVQIPRRLSDEQRDAARAVQRRRSPTRTCAPTSRCSRACGARCARTTSSDPPRGPRRPRGRRRSPSPSCSRSRPPASRRSTATRDTDRVRALRRARASCRALPALQASVGDALVEVATSEIADDWATRWRDFHQPVEVAGRALRAPAVARSGPAAAGLHRHRDRARAGLRDGRPRDHASCASSCSSSSRAPARRAARCSTSAPAPACSRSPRRSSASRRSRRSTTSSSPSRRRSRTPRANGVAIDVAPPRPSPRRACRARRPIVANLLRPLLLELAARIVHAAATADRLGPAARAGRRGRGGVRAATAMRERSPPRRRRMGGAAARAPRAGRRARILARMSIIDTVKSDLVTAMKARRA